MAGCCLYILYEASAQHSHVMTAKIYGICKCKTAVSGTGINYKLALYRDSLWGCQKSYDHKAICIFIVSEFQCDGKA